MPADMPGLCLRGDRESWSAVSRGVTVVRSVFGRHPCAGRVGIGGLEVGLW